MSNYFLELGWTEKERGELESIILKDYESAEIICKLLCVRILEAINTEQGGSDAVLSAALGMKYSEFLFEIIKSMYGMYQKDGIEDLDEMLGVYYQAHGKELNMLIKNMLDFFSNNTNVVNRVSSIMKPFE